MRKNIGAIDRVVRLLLGAALLGLYGALDPPLQYATVIGLLPVGTALTGRCPLYSLVGIDTTGRRPDEPA